VGVDTAFKQGCHIGRLLGKSHPKNVVRTGPDVPASGRTSKSADHRRTAGWLAWQTAPNGRPLDGMPSATPPGGRHGGRPSDRRSPAPTVGWMADGGSVRRSRGQPASRRAAGRTAWRTPPLGPSARGRPPGAVRPAETLESHNY
jgi:hypothetical protein